LHIKSTQKSANYIEFGYLPLSQVSSQNAIIQINNSTPSLIKPPQTPSPCPSQQSHTFPPSPPSWSSQSHTPPLLQTKKAQLLMAHEHDGKASTLVPDEYFPEA
jgi:hypothetical protein